MDIEKVSISNLSPCLPQKRINRLIITGHNPLNLAVKLPGPLHHLPHLRHSPLLQFPTPQLEHIERRQDIVQAFSGFLVDYDTLALL